MTECHTSQIFSVVSLQTDIHFLTFREILYSLLITVMHRSVDVILTIQKKCRTLKHWYTQSNVWSRKQCWIKIRLFLRKIYVFFLIIFFLEEFILMVVLRSHLNPMQF